MEKFNEFSNQIKTQEKSNDPIQEIIYEAESINIGEHDRNQEGLLLSSDGTISHYQNELYWKIIKTNSFKRWFQKSITVYEDNGEPLMVFHSTLKKKIVGSNLKVNEKADDWNSYGVYFSSNKKATIDFYNTQYKDDTERFRQLLKEDSTEKNEIILEREKYSTENEDKVKTFNSFIKIEKPLKLNNHEELMETSWAGFSRKDLIKEYDGIVITNDTEFSDQYIVFKEENILVLPSNID